MGYILVIIICPRNPTPGHILRENHNSKRYMHPIFTVALFTTARTRKQLQSASPEEWIEIMWDTYQFSSVAQSCPTHCDPMNRSIPGLPVHHQLPEITQTQVHRVGDAIQPSHPLLSPSPPAPNPSQHQGLFQ